jgi:uncharacterized protein (DUF1697 family)
MHRQVAFLRGINVGKAKRIAMADLRRIVEGLGYEDVRTVLNTGNVIFTGPDPTSESAARIQGAIESDTGISSRVTVVSSEELDTAVRENALADVATNPSRLLLAFLTDPADRARLQPLLDGEWGEEILHLGARVAYLWCPEGVLASKLPEAIGRALGDAVTTRNWATVLKIHAMLNPPTGQA